MKTVLQGYAKRIDALTLRERVILFLSLVLVLAALADSLLFSPALAQRKQIATATAKYATELQVLRDQLNGVSRASSADTPQGRLLAQIAQAQQQRDALDRELRAHLVGADERARLPQFLNRVLRRHDRLLLVRLVASNQAPSSNMVDAGSLHWQGVDLSVAGAYLDLMGYLSALEQAMPSLRWGELRISTDTSPPLMNVKLFLVGEMP